MTKMAERIKDDLMKEVDVFKDALNKVVEESTRRCGVCCVSLLSDEFNTGRDYRSMSDVRVPVQYAFYVEKEYTFQGFKVEKEYTPAGHLGKLKIRL